MNRTVNSTKQMELRRIIELNRRSKSLGFSIPSEWAEEMRLSPKQYVKLELDEDSNGFHVGRIIFQQV